jgi:hypothetical protein
VRAREGELPRRLAVAVALATVAMAAVTACSASHSNSASKIHSPSSDGWTQLVQASAQAVRNARSVEVDTLTSSAGGPVVGRFALFSDGSAEGTATISAPGFSAQLQLIQIAGTSYIRAPATFWTYAARSETPAQDAALASHWVTGSGRLFDSIATTSISSFADLIGSLTNDHNLQGAGSSIVHGEPATGIRASQGVVLWVANRGTPYPLELTGPGPPSLTANFSAWNAGTPPVAPAGAIPLSASA